MIFSRKDAKISLVSLCLGGEPQRHEALSPKKRKLTSMRRMGRIRRAALCRRRGYDEVALHFEKENEYE
jgi:hypothetical protein